MDSALLAPPLGATVFNAVRAPSGRDSAPRTIVLGHTVGLLAGLASISVWSGGEVVSALRDSFELAHAAAAGTAVALTCLAMGALRAVHPPALATTLVGALGLMTGAAAAVALFAGASAVAGGAALARGYSTRSTNPAGGAYDEIETPVPAAAREASDGA